MQEILHAFGIDWRLIVIQVFNFVILMGLLWYLLYGPVLKLINERKEKIAKGIQDAEDAKALKDNAETERAGILTEAQKEAGVVAQKAKEYADQKTGEAVAAAEVKAEQIVTNATTKGVELQKKMEKESEAEIAKLAVLAAEKVLKERA